MRVRTVRAGEERVLAAISSSSSVAHAPDGDVFLVAEIDGRPAGWLAGTLNGAYAGPGMPTPPPHGYVQAAVVHPGHRRAGVEWVFAVPDEDTGVEAWGAFFSACGFSPVQDPEEAWPVMGAHPV